MYYHTYPKVKEQSMHRQEWIIILELQEAINNTYNIHRVNGILVTWKKSLMSINKKINYNL